MLYDPLGRVLTSTLTAALEAALSSQGAALDSATGLVHLGGWPLLRPVGGQAVAAGPGR